MIQLDITGILNDKGIEYPNKFLRQHGFSQFIASRMLSHKSKGISFAYLERICTALHCTPNDLFTWSAATGAKKEDNQPLHQLTAVARKPQLSSVLKDLPIEKVREIRNAIDELMKTA